MTAFTFKQFTIHARQGVHPVGTDGVLLGAWTEATAGKILDIGAGTGLIALMLAQKSYNSTIWAVEPDLPAFEQMQENIAASPWSDRIRTLCARAQELDCCNLPKFDLIVSNPPFYLEQVYASDPARRRARHADQLPPAELLRVVRDLLAPKGRFCCIAPPNTGSELLEWGALAGVYGTRRTKVYSKMGQDCIRYLLQFETDPMHFKQDELVIYEKTGGYTSAYKKLTAAYYLNLP